jgi:hypothetical protein
VEKKEFACQGRTAAQLAEDQQHKSTHAAGRKWLFSRPSSRFEHRLIAASNVISWTVSFALFSGTERNHFAAKHCRVSAFVVSTNRELLRTRFCMGRSLAGRGRPVPEKYWALSIMAVVGDQAICQRVSPSMPSGTMRRIFRHGSRWSRQPCVTPKAGENCLPAFVSDFCVGESQYVLIGPSLIGCWHGNCPEATCQP